MALLKVKTDKNHSLTIIQIYAPTSLSEETEIELLYENIDQILSKNNTRKNDLIIMGDFNGQVGLANKEEKETIGGYGFGNRNDRGWRLLRFCQERNLKIINGFFKKRKDKRWTWLSPNYEHKTLIDYIIVPKNNKNITDFNTISSNKFKYQSDHKLILCKLKLKNKKHIGSNKIKSSPRIITDNHLYNLKLSTLLEHVTQTTHYTTNELNNLLTKSMIQAANMTNDQIRNLKNITVIENRGNNLASLYKKRAHLLNKNKTKRDKIELNQISKLIRLIIREKEYKKRTELIKQTLEGNKNIKALNKKLSLGLQWTTYLEKEDGTKIYNRIDINNLATQFYQNIYNDPLGSSLPSHKYPSPSLIIGKRDDNVTMEEDLPPFILPEIIKVISNLKNNKASGKDGITNEHIKNNVIIAPLILNLFNKILQIKEIPEDWKCSDIILILKKGNKHHIENYRPISLSPVISRIFSKVIENRIRNTLKFYQPIEQVGFRSGYSTYDHLHVINQLLEKSHEYNFEISLAFIDYTKAFDSVRYPYLISALKNHGVHEKLLNIISNSYTNLKARIITDITGPYFSIEKGVRQGDPLSPILFNSILEKIFKNLDWGDKGISINGEKVSNLRFADDVVIIAGSFNQLEEMLHELDNQGREAGLNINTNKTKILTNNSLQRKIKISGTQIENITETIYLGQLISLENSTLNEINRRVLIGWKKFWSLKEIMKGDYNTKLKREIFNLCVLPALTYGSPTWTLNEKINNILQTTQNSMSRSILKIKRRDKIPQKKINKKLHKIRNILTHIRYQKWNWASHISRLNDNR
ncbi:hypothetical protein PGB90_005549 [Kerria lacca]